MPIVIRNVVLIGLVAAMGPAASAQDGAVLSGPRVERVSPPGMEKTFGMALANNPMVVRDSISMQTYRQMLESIEGEAALSEEQLSSAKEFEEAWRRRVWAYYATVMSELQAVHDALPENEARRMAYMLRGGERAIKEGLTMEPAGMELSGPVADAMSMTGMNAMDSAGLMSELETSEVALRGPGDARGLLARIRRATPLPWEEQSGIWAMLSESQRDAMAERILAYRMEQRLAREQREMKRAAERRGDDAVGPTLVERTQLLETASRTGVLAAALHRQLTDEERAALDVLEAEERASAVRALAERLLAQESRRDSVSAEPKERATTDGGKPAPSLEALEIPTVDEKNIEGAETTPGE